MSGKNIYSQNINKQFNKQTCKKIYPNSIHSSIKGVQQGKVVKVYMFILHWQINRQADRKRRWTFHYISLFISRCSPDRIWLFNSIILSSKFSYLWRVEAALPYREINQERTTWYILQRPIIVEIHTFTFRRRLTLLLPSHFFI